MNIFVRSRFNYDTAVASDESGLMCEDKSLAQQHQKEEADINTIVRRFGLTGELPENVRVPQYGDFTGISDYRSALHAVMGAESAFMELPADLRSRFGNDPEVYVNFCMNPENVEEMIKLGLAVRKATDEGTGVLKPVPEPVATPPVAGGGKPADKPV